MSENQTGMSPERKAEWIKILQEARAKTSTEEGQEALLELITKLSTEMLGSYPQEHMDIDEEDSPSITLSGNIFKRLKRFFQSL